MGLRTMFKKVKNAVTFTDDNNKYDSTRVDKEPPLRWEKAVIAMNGIVHQVSKIDPDGVDVVCFPGSGGEGGMQHDIYRNVKDMVGLEAMVTCQAPQGPCQMGQAMTTVLNEAFQKRQQNGGKRPSTILVLTAGRPDDYMELTETLSRAAKQVQSDAELTITFVQVGDDEWATNYLRHLDHNLTTTNKKGQTIDIVDSIKDEDIKAALKEIKKELKEGHKKANSGSTGAMVGAFTGAAMGIGGMYMANKMHAKNRGTDGWTGKWKASYEGEEICVLEVNDDMGGNLNIKGWPEHMTNIGFYVEMDNGGLNIVQMTPDCPEDIVVGTIEDEHTIAWDDGTRWEEVPPKGVSWAKYAGAAVTGAVVGAATGYLLQKKFFNKASRHVESDYIIVLDRSGMMAVPDTGK